MDLKEAMNVVLGALQCYSEDCISADSQAQDEIEMAWFTLSDFIEGSTNG